MPDDLQRSRAARAVAEKALARVVHYYGARPEFVVLGGLVPEYLCIGSGFRHAGTIDVDVQVDLEIACGSVNTQRLEQALLSANFTPEADQVWRWSAAGLAPGMVVKFELLADLDDVLTEQTVKFNECVQLGAVNLRGTGFAAEDIIVRELRTGSENEVVEVNFTGLAGFILAKCAAARSRRMPKDWYDIAFCYCITMSVAPKRLHKRCLSDLVKHWNRCARQ